MQQLRVKGNFISQEENKSTMNFGYIEEDGSNKTLHINNCFAE